MTISNNIGDEFVGVAIPLKLVGRFQGKAYRSEFLGRKRPCNNRIAQ